MMEKERMNNDEQMIEKLLDKFYSGTIEPHELQSLYAYFLAAKPVAEQFRMHVPVLRPLAIMHSRIANTDAATTNYAKRPKRYALLPIATIGWAAAVAVVLILLLPTFIGNNPVPPNGQIAEATMPIPVDEIIQRQMPEDIHYAKPAKSMTKQTRSADLTIYNNDICADTYDNATYTTNAAICMAEDTETNKTDNIADTALAIPYNNHKEWVIYCNNSCSSLELNNIVATTLNTHTQYNEQI